MGKGVNGQRIRNKLYVCVGGEYEQDPQHMHARSGALKGESSHAYVPQL